MALDANLTELGRKQAEATAEYLLAKPILLDGTDKVILVSPFRRTLQTCKPIAEHTNLPAHVFPWVCEYFSHTNDAYHAFEGLSRRELTREYPFVQLDEIAACKDAWWPMELEDTRAIYDRSAAVRDALYEQFAGTDTQVMIVSHAEPIGRLIEAMLRISPDPGWPPWTENCGISRLIVEDPSEPADLVVLNDTSHLKVLGLVSKVLP